jgi:hypothetical protein
VRGLCVYSGGDWLDNVVLRDFVATYCYAVV